MVDFELLGDWMSIRLDVRAQIGRNQILNHAAKAKILGGIWADVLIVRGGLSAK